jgi:hypothetical protein
MGFIMTQKAMEIEIPLVYEAIKEYYTVDANSTHLDYVMIRAMLDVLLVLGLLTSSHTSHLHTQLLP